MIFFVEIESLLFQSLSHIRQRTQRTSRKGNIVKPLAGDTREHWIYDYIRVSNSVAWIGYIWASGFVWYPCMFIAVPNTTRR